MYHLNVTYPRGRMMTFSSTDHGEAFTLFSDIVNDAEVLAMEFVDYDDDPNTMFDSLIEIYRSCRIREDGGFRRWLNHPHAKLQYYNGYVDPNELYNPE